MPNFVLSPCGTSVLTNQAQPNERGLISTYANTRNVEQIPAVDREVLKGLVTRATEHLEGADLRAAARASAELNGIIKLYEGQLSQGQRDQHVLLSTDTWLGQQTAAAIATWLEAQGLNAQVEAPKDLQTEHLEGFQSALIDLVRWCEETLPGYREARYRVIFNLTGGFKSVQGFLQTLASFWADETVYVFERSEQLLRIPRLPIKMDVDNSLRQHLGAFRRLSLGLAVPTEQWQAIPETLLLILDGAVGLSVWGELVWGQAWRQFYEEQLWPAPSNKMIYGPKFEDSLEGLAGDRLRHINCRLDQLANFLETGINPRSLDFTRLEGNPVPPSTHEVDAWADQDAKRIFCHYEEGILIIDRLAEGLH